ncbi:MAG TPA: chloride channel protein [Gemmatimonadales bacterium]|nr:chloride channel protein [Gemmatimonadales bacterium]
MTRPGESSPLAAATAPLRAVASQVTDLVTALGTDRQTTLLALAAVTGTLVGLAVTLFYRLIDVVQALVLRGAMGTLVSDVVLLPAFVALGLVVSRFLVRQLARGSEGENIPDVMYRVSVKGGDIPLRPVLAKTVAAATLIGTGGSVGAEGPVIVLGAGTASRLGRFLRASPQRVRTLAGCGAAAGLAAAFNAPIAGVIFGIEKITGAAGGAALGPYVVSSILAATVSRAVFGNRPVLAIPAEYGVRSAWELILYVALGLLSGIVAVIYSRGVWRAQDIVRRIRSPLVQVLLGALIVGGLDLLFRADLWGQGHESLDLNIIAERTAPFLLGLAAAKLVATAVTIAVGRTGGVFTPALFIGATLGGAFGAFTNYVVPELRVAPHAIGLVGMAGVVAGATHAPLTAIMMVFEMTGDYGLIMPLMLTSVLAYVVARRLHPESIYTEWLARRGVVLTQGADAVVLARLTVGDCANRSPTTISADASMPAIIEQTRASRQTEFPVVTGAGNLVGMVSRAAIREIAEKPESERPAFASDLVRDAIEPVTPDDSLLTALSRLGSRDVEYLPVVSTRNRSRLVGIVSRHDLTAAYERGLALEEH